MYQIYQFYFSNKPNDNINILGDNCLVYSLNIQACPGTTFQIGENKNSSILIGTSGNLKIECEKYPIDKIIIKNTPAIESYPIIIDIVYKGEILYDIVF